MGLLRSQAVWHPVFYRVRKTSGGMLQPRTYRAIFDFARRAAPGAFVEIGTAQGAATIALGMACKRSQLKRQLLSFDKFEGSNSLKSKTDVRLNIEVAQGNLRRFGLDMVASVFSAEEIEQVIHKDLRISLLMIDADGAIDRDFLNMAPNFTEDAIMIVDDYEPVVNRQGARYLKKSIPELEQRFGGIDIKSLSQQTPLGKHLTTWRLVNALIEFGYFRLEKVVANTAFLALRPVSDRMISLPTLSQRFLEIREQTSRDFIEFRTEILSRLEQ